MVGSTRKPLTVLHLVGSAESDQLADVSRLYARGCLAALAAADGADRYRHVVAHVSPDGTWCFPASLSPADLAAAPAPTLAEAALRLAALRPDVAVPQMFCLSGMTHHRALLELLGVPHLGNPPHVMALGADKALARAVVAAAGVRVPEGAVVALGDPCPVAGRVVVKPVDADNSSGVTLVDDASDRAAFDAAVGRAVAAGSSPRALVESYVELGREVRCGVLEVAGELVCLPLEEYAVDADTKPVRLADDKLARDDRGELGLVAKDAAHAWIVDPSDPLTDVVHDSVRAAYRALGCRQYGLFDLRVDPDGTPYFLEASLYCSFAPTSVLVVMAEAAGLPLPRLFDRMVADALQPARPREVTQCP